MTNTTSNCKVLLFSLLTFWQLPQVFAQVSRGGSPLSFQFPALPPPPVVTMPEIDRDRLRLEDAVNDLTNAPLRFAFGFPVILSLDNAGQWTELPGGDRLWQLKIDCPSASSINLLYDDFFMPPGARYFLYRPDGKEILGAFGSHNNRDSRRFATALIHDEQIILEYFEPAAARGQGRLSIAQVAHGYRLLSDLENSEGLNDGGNCQVNVNCTPEGDDWQAEKKAVTRIIMDGIFLCSGALVNNSAGDCRPYVLTADHCIDFSYDAVTNPDAPNFVFYWNYERPGCPNTGSVPIQTTVGCTVRANSNVGTASAASDFALLELTTNPGNFYDVYFAGFDASGNPGTGGAGIHHPGGDAKKIATHSITPTSVVNNRYWRIYWDQTPNGWSVTEGGSSGSPLFNSDRRIIGQLFGGFLGGQPNCSDPANDEGDYGKLSYSWGNNGATDSRRRLRDWLDPVGNGNVQVVDGTASACNGCELTGSGLASIGCDNNGTPDDGSDDRITFTLNPVGNNLSNNYTISGTNMTTATGLYGSPTIFTANPGTAGSGQLSLTITDGTSTGCQLSVLITDPGNCAGTSCAITDIGLINLGCNDNGTPDNPNDDRITFQLTVAGVNTGQTYSLDGNRLSSTSGTYGIPKLFFTSGGTAGSGDLEIEIRDDANPDCIFIFLLSDPGACSGPIDDCDLFVAGLSDVQCDDNDTPADATDDQIVFLLDPQGANLGSGYTIAEPGYSPAGGTYGGPTAFSAPAGSAGAGDLVVTIVDNDNPGCILEAVGGDPGVCSSAAACGLQSAGLNEVLCNDNGTPEDPNDDYLDFNLDPQGIGLGTAYSVSGSGVNTQLGTYGGPVAFSTLPGTAGGSDLMLTITDGDDPGCILALVLPAPGNCSDPGAGDSCGVDNVTCSDFMLPIGGDGIAVINLNDLLVYTGPPDAGCDYQVTLLSPRSPLFDCGDLGANTVVLRIRAADGGQTFCTATVMVTDPSGNCDEGERQMLSGEASQTTGENGLRVFPIPARDHLRVQFEPVPANGRLLLTDRFGRAVRQWSVPAGSRSSDLQVAELPAGLYVLAYRVEGRVQYLKVILTD